MRINRRQQTVGVILIVALAILASAVVVKMSGCGSKKHNPKLQEPKIVWEVPSAIASGIPLDGMQLNAIVTDAAGNKLDGTIDYTPGPGYVLPVGKQKLSVTFVPTDTAHYTKATKTVDITVNEALPPTPRPTPTMIIRDLSRQNDLDEIRETAEEGQTVRVTPPSSWNHIQYWFIDWKKGQSVDVGFPGTIPVRIDGPQFGSVADTNGNVPSRIHEFTFHCAPDGTCPIIRLIGNQRKWIQ